MTDTLTIQQTNATGIQAALNKVGEDEAYDALRLSSGVYNINKPMAMNSGTEIFGPKTAVFKLAANAPRTLFKQMIPILGQKKPEIHDISVHGFTFDGQSGRQNVKWGQGYDNFLYLQHATDVTVQNMILQKSQGDGVRFRYSENIDVAGCKINEIGHDGGYFLDCENVNFVGNEVKLRTNSACRTSNTNRVKICDNLITGSNNWWAGGPGIQIDHSNLALVDQMEVYNNRFYQTYGPAFWLNNHGEASTDLSLCKDYHIHDNLMVECGLNPTIDWTAGLLWSGVDNVLFEYNTLVDCYRYGIAGHVGSSVWSTKPKGKGYVLSARNNIITGTKQGRFDNGVKTGQGMALTLFVTHSVNSMDNRVFGNAGGGYSRVNASLDSDEPVELDSFYMPTGKDSSVDCGCRIGDDDTF